MTQDEKHKKEIDLIEKIKEKLSERKADLLKKGIKISKDKRVWTSAHGDKIIAMSSDLEMVVNAAEDYLKSKDS